VKTLSGIAFQSEFGHARLLKTETETMLLLREDEARRSAAGFTLNNYGMDLSRYEFDSDME
jgi:hypothetical protein